MGLNLSRGSPIKYYSSDRIAQIIGNGLVALIDNKTCYNDFFNNSRHWCIEFVSRSLIRGKNILITTK